jgi:hypothetical protein
VKQIKGFRVFFYIFNEQKIEQPPKMPEKKFIQMP